MAYLVIDEITEEVNEIVTNIRTAARTGEITWQQREELLVLVYQDANDKLELAKSLLYNWTGKYNPRGDEPLVA